MKKRKIIIYSIVLLLLLSCIGLGTFSLLMGEKFTNNNIVFEVNDEEAYCQISGEYFYNNVVDADKAYTPKMYTYGSNLNEEGFDGFEMWDIGDSNFDLYYDGLTPETFKYVITIQNLNHTKALAVTLEDVAVGEKIKNDYTIMCFTTKITYKVGSDDEVVQFSNKENEYVNYNYYTIGQTVVDINNAVQIPVNSSLTIVVELERVTKVEQFIFQNNFKVNIQTAQTQS